MFTPGEPRARESILEKARAQGLVTATPTDTIVRDEYTPALIHLVSNILVWGGSRIFHHLHGVGMNEWRILSALANYPGATARDVIEVLGMNKSIASRSVNRLLELELVAQLNGSRGSRHLFLTDEGAHVHEDLLRVALQRDKILHSNLSADEVTTLNTLLVRLLDSADALQEFEQGLLRDVAHASRTTTSSKAARGT
ncbi:MarR family winged helix-turn-helix transcriptional regulator [Microbacterium halotolerans]|uniref:MarR family winged helix-turn-helix transcriptional regulator n=1 Tax=Microbacterium halotolerans TaxID=246613 RepID=UPI000E6AC0D7|nr:MarR family transcriptional regulator [Microbacterium halotolerans]